MSIKRTQVTITRQPFVQSDAIAARKVLDRLMDKTCEVSSIHRVGRTVRG